MSGRGVRTLASMALGVLALWAPGVVSGQTRLTFVRVESEQPLRVSPPLGLTDASRLAVSVSGLAANREARLVVRQLADLNGDGRFQPEEITVLVQLDAGQLKARRRPLDADRFLVLLPTPGTPGVEQLEAELTAPDGTWLVAPAALTLRRAGGETTGLFGRLASVSATTFDRLLRYYDVIRADLEEAQRMYVMDLIDGLPGAAPRELATAAVPVRALALSPGGETLAWVHSVGAGAEVWRASLAPWAARRVLSAEGPVTGVGFAGDGLLVARGRELVRVGQSEAGHQTYALPVRGVSDLHQARATTEGFEAVLDVDAGGTEGASARYPMLVSVDRQGEVRTARLRAHELYGALAHAHPAGYLYVRVRGARGDRLSVLRLADESSRDVVACRRLGAVSVAAGGSRVAFAGIACVPAE